MAREGGAVITTRPEQSERAAGPSVPQLKNEARGPLGVGACPVARRSLSCGLSPTHAFCSPRCACGRLHDGGAGRVGVRRVPQPCGGRRTDVARRDRHTRVAWPFSLHLLCSAAWRLGPFPRHLSACPAGARSVGSRNDGEGGGCCPLMLRVAGPSSASCVWRLTVREPLAARPLLCWRSAAAAAAAAAPSTRNWRGCQWFLMALFPQYVYPT